MLEPKPARIDAPEMMSSVKVYSKDGALNFSGCAMIIFTFLASVHSRGLSATRACSMSSLCSDSSGGVVCARVPRSSVPAPVETDVSLRLPVACIERREVLCGTDVQETNNPFAL